MSRNNLRKLTNDTTFRPSEDQHREKEININSLLFFSIDLGVEKIEQLIDSNLSVRHIFYRELTNIYPKIIGFFLNRQRRIGLFFRRFVIASVVNQFYRKLLLPPPPSLSI